MSADELIYFLFGLSLVITLAGIIKFYYSRKRHKSVEEAKYRMMEDDD
ncbi:MAG: CcoQ/FixQ family Cbb3-type cytochrome c oxidase assembly chaperone [Nitrospirales bacterium]|nr:CcoQ/FixQ family Cbb3-type cytochrome c oxidase assembly chaperone [Nitrospirales bacterium]